METTNSGLGFRGFPKIRCACLGVPDIRAMVY